MNTTEASRRKSVVGDRYLDFNLQPTFSPDTSVAKNMLRWATDRGSLTAYH